MNIFFSSKCIFLSFNLIFAKNYYEIITVIISSKARNSIVDLKFMHEIVWFSIVKEITNKLLLLLLMIRKSFKLKLFHNLREKLLRERKRKWLQGVGQKRFQCQRLLRARTYCQGNLIVSVSIRLVMNIVRYTSLHFLAWDGNRLTAKFCCWKSSSNLLVHRYRSCINGNEKLMYEDKIFSYNFLTIPFRFELSSKRAVPQSNWQNHPWSCWNAARECLEAPRV